MDAAQGYEIGVVLRLAVATGIRREDLVRIRVEGVDEDGGRVRYYESKKRRWREVDVGGETQRALANWLVARQGHRVWLFPSNYGLRGQKSGHRSGRWAYDALQETLKRAGLAPRPFHALRATCVKLCQRRGWTPEQVSKLTGDTIRVIQLHYATPSRDEMSQVAKEKPLL